MTETCQSRLRVSRCSVPCRSADQTEEEAVSPCFKSNSTALQSVSWLARGLTEVGTCVAPTRLSGSSASARGMAPCIGDGLGGAGGSGRGTWETEPCQVAFFGPMQPRVAERRFAILGSLERPDGWECPVEGGRWFGASVMLQTAFCTSI
jgi:hypothetical protein